MKRFTSYSDNGELILEAHQLGHVRGVVLDATYGYGTWWSCAEGLTRVHRIATMDIDPAKAAGHWCMDHIGAVTGDFRRPPFREGAFDTILYDPDYKLNGTPTPEVGGPDERYGAHVTKTWQQRQADVMDGLANRGAGIIWGPDDDGLARLLAPNGRLLMKCMDQVSSGAMRWQTFEAYRRAENAGLELVDLAEFEIHPRPQPPGRKVVHFEANYSTLMIFGRPPIRRGR